MDQKIKEQQEKRELRRKRRIRAQVFAYINLIILLALMAGGIVYGVQYLTKKSEQNTQEMQQQVDEMLGTEETLEVPDTQPETEQVIELTPQQKLDEIVNAGIEVMPLEDKVAGLFIVTPESITGVSTAVKAGDGTRQALTKYSVGGIIYNTKNIQNETQFKEMIDTTKLYSNYPLFIAIEDEGGSVSPLAEKQLVDKQTGAEELGQTNDASQVQAVGEAIGGYLSEYGFNLDLAPVADLNSVANSIMAKRSYGSSADVVSPLVAAMTEGLKSRNISTCLKHFPGMGSTTQNPDTGLASSDRSAEDFRANEFAVFQAGINAGTDMVMVSHMAAPSLSGDNTPSSMSSVIVTDILRNELGFDGVIITDAMNLKAISDYYGADEAAVMALKAGCDMILMPEDFEKAYNGVLDAVQNGVISEERINDALRRVYRVKYADRVTE
ncbi:MAG: beta-N-acetylhexosaminidase [Lachnospiraceae bacterium]|nr:beta-N-acetylhexosaminidase [Lachnospiraceae bacterium]MBQ8116794.1 beta-N-acetylhexosaminidase [Lachnospiraceae bacterium]MBR1854377.1 beta-N-acetylhexosaminidase [Lachnospiraceae bacterium]